MNRDYFISLEKLSNKTQLDLSDVIEQLAFDEQGLIPVITQDASTKSILMFAWMNKQALEKTILNRRMTYWSRSRQKLWIKGETSGHTQELVAMSFDCDGDAILCLVDQSGAACHTGRPDCFYLQVDLDNKQVLVDGDAA
jgi:phosphoribosyl-AMP cyclohydrolase